MGAIFKVGSGKMCRFWEGCWAQGVPLKIAFEDIYKMAREPNCSVADCWEQDSWVVDFKRSLSTQEYNSWLGLLDALHDKALIDNKSDSVIWALDRGVSSLPSHSTGF